MTSLVFYAIALSGIFVTYAIVCFLRWRSSRQRTRNPLNRDLLRSPGQSLRDEIDELSFNLVSDASTMMLMSCVAALLLSLLVREGTPPWSFWIIGIGLVVSLGYFGRRLIANFQRRERLRLGLDAEMATGEELNQLMLRGCRIFHDVPAEHFNIDHVVVGPGGVLAVETKGRAKPARGLGKADARVTYDGNTLRFPGWEERKPVDQAKSQAAWLGKWLANAMGEPVAVLPALALPGWFVERKGAGDVIVFNPKRAGFLAEPFGMKELSGQFIERIAHQLEQRCRTVGPRALRQAD